MTVCSVVVLTYNSQDDISACLDSVLDQSFGEDYEVIVADNNSTDRTTQIVETEFPMVRLAEFDQNWGTAEGYNKAFERTTGEYVIYLNPDTVVHYQWLEELHQTVTKTGAVAAHSCVFEPYHEEFSGLDRHADPDNRVMFELTPLGFVTDQYTGKEAKETLFLSATSMIIRRDVVMEMDEFFDKDLPMYGEDLDLSLRLALSEYKTVHAPGSIVYHRQYQKNNISSPYWLLKKYVWVTTSRSHAFYKAMSDKEYLFMLPRLFVAGIANVRVLRVSPWKKFLVFLASVFLSAFSLLYSLLKNRRYTRKRQRLSEKQKDSVYTRLIER